MREENLPDLRRYCRAEAGAFAAYDEVLEGLQASFDAHGAQLQQASERRAKQLARLGDARELKLLFAETDSDGSGELDAQEAAVRMHRRQPPHEGGGEGGGLLLIRASICLLVEIFFLFRP